MPNPKLFIDGLRTRCWFRQVFKRSGCDSPDKVQEAFSQAIALDRFERISKEFHAIDIRWREYLCGDTRPSPKILDAIHNVFRVSRDFYEDGPSGLLLWKALAIIDPQKLNTLVNYSADVDGLIADMRFRVLTSDSSLTTKLSDLHAAIGMGVSPVHCLEKFSPEIFDRLSYSLEDITSVSDVAEFIIEEFTPYCLQALTSEVAPSRIDDLRFKSACLKEHADYSKYKELSDTPLSHLI